MQRYRLMQTLYRVGADLPAGAILSLDALDVAVPAGQFFCYDMYAGLMVAPDYPPIPVPGGPALTHWQPVVERGAAPGEYHPYAPTGARIVGTVDTIPGVAIIANVTVDENGAVEPIWAGETSVGWNGQRTVFEAGERVYVDEHNDHWRESQLVLVPTGSAAIIGTDDTEGGLCD